ncbi:MAG TPA: hypothetical protein VN739_02510 [Nitrososphaerales archaeon]|nr:hypothetical protein [Nitrososphaerales archaeon]
MKTVNDVMTAPDLLRALFSASVAENVHRVLVWGLFSVAIVLL